MRQALNIHTGFLVLAICAIVTTGGCAIYHKTADDTTNPVMKDKLGRLRKGETTRKDVVAALGEPTRVEKLGENRERLVYEYEWQEETKYDILFVFSWEDEEDKTSTLNFEFKDGVLVRHWKEVTTSQVEEVKLD